jgi:hypothetical protein
VVVVTTDHGGAAHHRSSHGAADDHDTDAEPSTAPPEPEVTVPPIDPGTGG